MCLNCDYPVTVDDWSCPSGKYCDICLFEHGTSLCIGCPDWGFFFNPEDEDYPHEYWGSEDNVV